MAINLTAEIPDGALSHISTVPELGRRWYPYLAL